MTRAGELVRQLEQALGGSDGQVQNVTNKAADEMVSCSITAYNELDDVVLAGSYMDLATATPCVGQVKLRRDENERTLRGIRERHDLEPLFAPLAGRRRETLASLPQAQRAVEALEGLLPDIRQRAGDRHRAAFVEESSLCSAYVLGFLIEHVNEAQESYGQRQDVAGLRNVIQTCLNLLQRIGPWVMSDDAREHFNRNHETLKDIAGKLANMQGAPAGKAWVGWILVLISVIIYKSCTG